MIFPKIRIQYTHTHPYIIHLIQRSRTVHDSARAIKPSNFHDFLWPTVLQQALVRGTLSLLPLKKASTNISPVILAENAFSAALALSLSLFDPFPPSSSPYQSIIRFLHTLLCPNGIYLHWELKISLSLRVADARLAHYIHTYIRYGCSTITQTSELCTLTYKEGEARQLILHTRLIKLKSANGCLSEREGMK